MTSHFKENLGDKCGKKDLTLKLEEEEEKKKNKKNC